MGIKSQMKGKRRFKTKYGRFDVVLFGFGLQCLRSNRFWGHFKLCLFGSFCLYLRSSSCVGIFFVFPFHCFYPVTMVQLYRSLCISCHVIMWFLFFIFFEKLIFISSFNNIQRKKKHIFGVSVWIITNHLMSLMSC